MPQTIGYTVFETAAGFAAMGWSARGVASFRLPGDSAASAERAVLKRFPDAVAQVPSDKAQAVIDGAQRYFAGEHIDFASVPVDLGVQDPFFERVYALVRGLGWGKTMTYGEVARALDAGPEAARTVGEAMARNPVPLIIPCHRVTAAGGKIGGFSAPGGSMSKARMLEMEGMALGNSDQMGFGF